MKQRYKTLIWGTLALIGSSLLGGSLWLWLAGLWLGKYIVRLLFAITLAIVVYILTYLFIVGGIFWLLIS
ncbi:hypothetical protein CBG53_00915 [Porphyromonas gingivalis]|uniref:hypothetical protein n=1 Tax=Porphyromonas gingivalis TaxID=837 RepID=UPI0003ACFE57|nr:hypothetical protein [Porphyromonas gingivalis]ERJ64286.1 hypothetical protein HMPREF1554_02167 [Porphyromonas gingivalis F0569]OWP34494.1 hypothetical protein CBG53_00915 [Porphyromonas gingivalis]OWR80687.1 trasnmembrane protein found in conjugate transposon [Porphyromonas gingivalis SJD11]